MIMLRQSSTIISLADAILVLQKLGGNAPGRNKMLCELLGFELADGPTLPAPARSHPTAQPPRKPTQPRWPGFEEEPAGPLGVDPRPTTSVEDLESEPEATDLAPQERGQLPARQRKRSPSNRDPLAAPKPRSDSGQTPTKMQQKKSLLRPEYQRSILRDLCLVLGTSGEPDLPEAVTYLAQGQPLARIPVRRRPRLARRVEVWLDQSLSMQPFVGDQDQVVARLQRTLAGSAVVKVSAWNGVPAPDAEALSHLLRRLDELRGTAILLLSDLGVGGAPAERLWGRMMRQQLRKWAALLHGFENRVSALVPCPARRWATALPRGLSGVEWSRRSRPSGTLRCFAAARTSFSSGDIVPPDKLRRLARAASFAARLTPALLRELRLRLLPKLGPEAEAELWGGPFSRTSSTESMSLPPIEAEALRAELPSYRELFQWLLEDRRVLDRAALPYLEPSVAISDGWDGESGLPSLPVAPSDWRRALPFLRTALLTEGTMKAAESTFPGWQAELDFLADDGSCVFAEQVRQITSSHARHNPHLALEEDLLWYSWALERSVPGASASLEATVASLASALDDPLHGRAAERAQDWILRRARDLPKSLRERPSVIALISAAQASRLPQGAEPAWGQFVDVYIALEGGLLLFSQAPLENAFRIRALAQDGVPLTVSAGGKDLAIRLRNRPLTVAFDVEHASVRNAAGDVFHLSRSNPPGARRYVEVDQWLAEAAADETRRDWIAVMRWAELAVSSAAVGQRAIFDAALRFGRAARLSDRRVKRALLFLERAEAHSADPNWSFADRVQQHLRLLICRSELLLTDSQLKQAGETADRGIAIAVANADSITPIRPLLARLRHIRFRTLRERGHWEECEAELAKTEAELADWRSSPDESTFNESRGWYGIMLGRLATHRGIRRLSKRALRILSELSGDLSEELRLESAEVYAILLQMFLPASAWKPAVAHAIDLASDLGDEVVLCKLRTLLIRSLVNSGEMLAAQRLLQYLADSSKPRTPLNRVRILTEQMYLVQQWTKSGAVIYLKSALDILSPDEAIWSAYLTAEFKSTQSGPSSESVRPAIHQLFMYGMLGAFADQICALVEKSETWALDMTRKLTGHEESATALLAMATELGPNLSTVNLLAAAGQLVEEPLLANRLFNRAKRIALALDSDASYTKVHFSEAKRLLTSLPQFQVDPLSKDLRTQVSSSIKQIDICIRILSERQTQPTDLQALYLLRAYAEYRLDSWSEARQSAQAAMEFASAHNSENYVIAATLCLMTIAWCADDISSCIRLLRVSLEALASNDREFERIADGNGRSNHPVSQGFCLRMLIDVLKSIKTKERSSETNSGPILTLAGGILQIMTDFYPACETGFNDLWYCVEQVKHLPLPELLAAYDVLISWDTGDGRSERLAKKFTRDRAALSEKLAKGPSINN
jgi:hypothetical protein